MPTIISDAQGTDIATQAVYNTQAKLLEMFREHDLPAIEKTLNDYITGLQKRSKEDTTLQEHFMYYYLRSITKECLRIGVSVERFESYVPAVSYLLQSDIAGCIDATVRLTEQVMKHISVHRTNETNHLLIMAKDYIRDHLGNVDLNLEAVSNHVGLSRVYFCKLFHQMEGVSFSAYLRNERISMAKHLLLTTNMKVFEVSNAVGFSHAKYFGKVFKEAVGITPVEFQNEHITNA